MTRPALLGFNRNPWVSGLEPKVCSRCGGKGIGRWPVTHMGVPGGCFKCDLVGKVFYVTTSQARDNYLANLEAGLADVTEQANEAKSLAAQALADRNARRARRGLAPLEAGGYHDRELERRLDQLRDHYRQVRAELRLCQAGDWPRLDRQARPF